MNDYTMKMVSVGGDIFVLVYYLGDKPENIEYAVPVGKLVDFLEKEDLSYIFKPKAVNDDNPNFVTGIPAIDNAVVHLTKPIFPFKD